MVLIYWKRAVSYCLMCLMVAAVSTSCGEPDHHATIETVFNPCEPLVVEPHPGLSDQEVASVELGLQYWRDAAGLELSTTSGAANAQMRVRFEEGAGFVHGFYDDQAAEVIINRNLSGQRARAVTLAHELGHAFGLYHVAADRRRSLMNPGNLDTVVTSEDVAALMARWDQCRPPSSHTR